MADTGNFFGPVEESTGLMFFGPTKETKPMTTSVVEELTDTYSSGLKRPPQDIVAALQGSMLPTLRADAGQMVDTIRGEQNTALVQQTLAEQPTDMVGAINTIREQAILGGNIAPDVALMLESNPDSMLARKDMRAIERTVAFQRIAESRLDREELSMTATVGYFADSMVSEPIQAILGVSLGLVTDGITEGPADLRDLALELGDLLYTEIPEEEFLDRSSAILDRVQDSGFFTQENPFFLNQFIALASEGAVGPEAELQTVFGAADILPSAALSGSIKALSRGLRSLPTMHAQIGTLDGAVRVAVRASDNAADLPINDLPRATSPAMSKPLGDGGIYMSSPDLTIMRQIEAENTALQIIKDGYVGSIIDDDVFETVKASLIQGVRDDLDLTYTNHAFTFDVGRDSFDNIVGLAYLGTNKSKPFKTIRNAQILADKAGGEVVPTIVEGRVQYLVRQETNIPFRDLIDPTDPNELASSWFSRLGSTTFRTTEELDSRLKIAEAGLGSIMNKASAEYTAIKRITSGDDIGRVNAILSELMDDPLFNFKTGGYTPTQFAERWGAKFNGATPSDNALNFYLKSVEISDASYFATADPILKNAVESGETMLKLEGTYFRAKPVNVPEGTMVYDVKAGVHVDSSKLPEGSVYTINNAAYHSPDGLPVRYVYQASPTTRRLFHSDVLGYRAGGRRVYTDLKILIKQESSTLMADGSTTVGKPKTFMAVRTELEATTATGQFNRVVNAMKEVVGQTLDGSAFRNAIRNLVDGDSAVRTKLDDIVANNSEWNINLSSIDDFIKFADDWKLDLSKEIDFAGDGKQLPVSSSTFAGEETLGNVFDTFNNPVGKRGAKPLKGFGGVELNTLDPTHSIENSFAKSVGRYGYSKYHESAVTGWVKGASGQIEGGRNIISNWAEVKHLNPVQAMNKAILDDTTKAGRAFENERRTINFSINSKTKDILAWEHMVDVLADAIYDKGYTKAARIVDLASTDPLKYLRAMAFTSKLGMFAFDQAWLQGSQILNLVGYSPKYAMRGSLSYTPLRLALNTTEDSVRRGIANRAAKLIGLSEDEFMETVAWIERSGRAVVDVNISELQGNSSLYKRGMSRTISKGNVFFNEGELIARISAISTAIMEHRGKFPLDDIFSDKATRSIMRRQDIMTASMSAASAAPWKKSMLSLPTQFLTYQQHMMEQIFISGILSNAEKGRLLASQAIILGAAGGSGMGFAGYYLDKFYYETGEDINPDVYSYLRYGTLDAVLTAITGSKTAVASRIGIGDGMYDMLKAVGENSFYEVVGGPAGGIGKDIFDATAQIVKNFGSFEYATYDWQTLGRNVTSVNRVYNAWVASRTGAYLSRKTNDPLMEDLSQMDSFMMGLGIPLQKNELMWQILAFQKNDDKVLQEHIRNAQRSDNIANDLFNKGELDAAVSVWADVAAMREILTPYELDKFDRAMQKSSSITTTLINRMFDRTDWGYANISGLGQVFMNTTAEVE